MSFQCLFFLLFVHQLDISCAFDTANDQFRLSATKICVLATLIILKQRQRDRENIFPPSFTTPLLIFHTFSTATKVKWGRIDMIITTITLNKCCSKNIYNTFSANIDSNAFYLCLFMCLCMYVFQSLSILPYVLCIKKQFD